jgi:F-type H+-transporting ATPase subunit b
MRTRFHNFLAVMLMVTALVLAGATVLAAQPEPGPAKSAPAAETHAPAGEHAAEAGSPIVGLFAKLFNFTLLVGTLVYFLRTPAATYLSDRGTQIRSDLVKAAEMKRSATAQLATIDAKMAALPGELDALRKTGAQEVAAEEARMRQAAEAERTRLIEQLTRDIDWQLRIAERDLRRHAGALAVDLATKRVKATITDADQVRLVNRYVAQVGK